MLHPKTGLRERRDTHEASEDKETATAPQSTALLRPGLRRHFFAGTAGKRLPPLMQTEAGIKRADHVARQPDAAPANGDLVSQEPKIHAGENRGRSQQLKVADSNERCGDKSRYVVDE